MSEKEPIKISLSTFFLIIAIIVIIVMGYFMYQLYSENMKVTKEATELKAQVDNLQGKINSIANVISNNTENTSNINNVSYIIAQVEDVSINELTSKMKIITDEKEIKSLMNIINSAKEYETKSFIPDFGDIPPCIEVYLSNGEKYTIAAGDDIDDNGNIVNLMTKWHKQDESDKALFKVDTKLAKYIENLYNTSKTSSLTEEKEIYKRVSVQNMDSSELEYYNETFIVLENDTIYFSDNLSNKILEGKYTINSNNTIEYELLQNTQDYAFYTAAIFRFENINGKKNIIVDNGPEGIIYYQKID